jgi:hypothetical protein
LTACPDVFPMQTTGDIADRLIVAAMRVFEVQLNDASIIEERCKKMLGVSAWPANPRNVAFDLGR